MQDITSTNAASFPISGTCSEDGRQVTLRVGSVVPSPQPSCSNGGWTVSMNVTGLNKTSGTINITANHTNSSGQSATQASDSVTNEFICSSSTNLKFVAVPALSGYSTKSFCVAKYEMKNDGSGNAISKHTGLPYTNLTRDQAITKCTDIGDDYDLITNDEWQALARSIESVGSNWSGGTVGSSGGLNRGHTDGSPWRSLEASAVDSAGCFGTGQTCSITTWHSQRRTHALSNGEIIWDVGGNEREIMKNSNYYKFGADTNISQITNTSHTISQYISVPTSGSSIFGPSRNAKAHFGPSGDYSSLNRIPYGGLGLAFVNHKWGAIQRGGSLGGATTGVFSVSLRSNLSSGDGSTTFRCVYYPDTTN